jgi:hypothetical protein
MKLMIQWKIFRTTKQAVAVGAAQEGGIERHAWVILLVWPIPSVNAFA